MQFSYVRILFNLSQTLLRSCTFLQVVGGSRYTGMFRLWSDEALGTPTLTLAQWAPRGRHWRHDALPGRKLATRLPRRSRSQIYVDMFTCWHVHIHIYIYILIYIYIYIVHIYYIIYQVYLYIYMIYIYIWYIYIKISFHIYDIHHI